MQDLIEALMIFAKYTNTKYPTHCEHDTLIICDVNPDDVTPENMKRLEELEFFVSDEYDDCFVSYRFGRA